MNAHKLPLDQISTVPFYGKHFPLVPWTLKANIQTTLIFARNLFRELGPLGGIAFWLLVPLRMVPTYWKYRAGFNLVGGKFGLMGFMQWMALVIVYEVLERKHDKEKAYEFIKQAIQDASNALMNDLYQADRLAEFEDPFDAFWAYHKAMFQDDPNWPNEFTVDEPDLKVMVVEQCFNCKLAQLTIPELARMGCDHDIVGYPHIEDKTQMVFRRPVTLAKDGKPCQFMFYRKGTEPQGPYENH